MKTFYELGTMPKAGDLIAHKNSTKSNMALYLVVSVVGDTYRLFNIDIPMNVSYIQTYYAPIGQETQ